MWLTASSVFKRMSHCILNYFRYWDKDCSQYLSYKIGAFKSSISVPLRLIPITMSFAGSTMSKMYLRFILNFKLYFLHIKVTVEQKSVWYTIDSFCLWIMNHFTLVIGSFISELWIFMNVRKCIAHRKLNLYKSAYSQIACFKT